MIAKPTAVKSLVALPHLQGESSKFAYKQVRGPSPVLLATAVALAFWLSGMLTQAHAQVGILSNWTGSVDNNFSNANNWTSGVPTPPTAGFIDQGTTGNASVLSNISLGVGVIEVGVDTSGPANSLTITNTGALTCDGLVIGRSQSSGATGIVIVQGGQLDASSQGITVGQGGIGTLTINSGGNVSNTGNIDVGFNSLSPSSLTVDGASSILLLQNGYLYVGTFGQGILTIVNGGEVEVSSSLNLTIAQNTGSTGTLNLNPGGILQMDVGSSLAIGIGSATLNVNGGTIRAGGDFTITAPLALASNSTINSNGHLVSVNSTINGTATLTTTGFGSVALNANSTFAAATISSDNLVVNAALTSNVTVNGAGGYLGGGGVVNGNVLVENGGIAPGIANAVTGNQAASFSALTINGNLAINVTTATFIWRLNHDDAAPVSDELFILGNLTTGSQAHSTITFDFQNTGYFNGVDSVTTYTLITADNDISNAGFTFAALNAGPTHDTNALSYFLFANGGKTLEFVLIPEPAAWGLVLGGAMLLLSFCRTRRKRCI